MRTSTRNIYDALGNMKRSYFSHNAAWKAAQQGKAVFTNRHNQFMRRAMMLEPEAETESARKAINEFKETLLEYYADMKERYGW